MSQDKTVKEIYDMMCSDKYSKFINRVNDEQETYGNVNASDILCELEPPTPDECAVMPICDIKNMDANSHGFCSPLNIHSSCLPGFLFYNDKNVSEYQKVTFESIAMDGWDNLQCLDEISYIPSDNGTNYRKKCKEYCFPNTRACCPGYYCPAGINCMTPCNNKGSYCPSSDVVTMEKECDPYGKPVFSDTMGCGGAMAEVTPCQAGYYCPNSKQKIICPEGHYCREGSVTPIKCMIKRYCKEGAKHPDDSIVAICVILLIIILAIMIYKHHKVRRYIKRIRNQYYICRFGLNLDEYIKQNRTNNGSEIKTFFGETLKETVDGYKSDSNEREGSVSIGVNEESEFNIEMIQPDNIEEQTDQSRTIGNLMDIEFKNLTLKLNKSNSIIIDNISGKLPVGTVTAILGPSGSGKTSLLYALCGKAKSYANISGDIFINGNKCNINKYKDITGFVPQNDIMHPKLTVKEILTFNCLLRLSKNKDINYCQNTVRDVLKILNLYDIRNSVVGDEYNRGISGGQKKRVNIGMELVAEPSILMCDEPTSGLDSTTANEIMYILNIIAKTGVTVLVSLHQPRYEIFKRFDNIILLNPFGQIVYNGKRGNIISYFESMGFNLPEFTNPADYIMDVISGKIESINKDFSHTILADKWDEQTPVYNTNSYIKMDETIKSSHYEPRNNIGFTSTVYLCLKRGINIKIRSHLLLLTDILMTAFSSVCIGTLADLTDLNAVPNTIMYVQMPFSILSCLVSLRLFGSDRLTYYRYASKGLNRFAYYWGQTFTGLFYSIVIPLLYVYIVFSFADFRSTFMEFFKLFLALMFTIQGFAHLASVLVNPAKAQVISVVFVLVFELFNGLHPTLKSLHSNAFTSILSVGAFARYIQELIWIVELRGWDNVYEPLKNAQSKHFGWNRDAYLYDIISLITLGIIFRIFTVIALFVVNKNKQT